MRPDSSMIAVTPSRGRLLTRLGVAWLAMSSAAIFIVIAAPVPPFVIAMLRVAITALVWLLIGARVLRPTWRILRADPGSALLLALSGILLAAHFALWISSLFHTSVAHATVLVALQPLFAGVLGRMLGDRATWRLYASIGVALVGTAVLTGGPSAESGGATLLGDGLAVLAAAASAAYLIAGRRVGERVPLAGSLAFVNGVAYLVLALLVLLFESDWQPASLEWTEGFAIVWLGLVPGLIGHGIMNWTARFLPVHTVSLAVLLEPVGATLLAYVALGQSIGPREVLGGGLLLAGAWLALGGGGDQPTRDPD